MDIDSRHLSASVSKFCQQDYSMLMGGHRFAETEYGVSVVIAVANLFCKHGRHNRKVWGGTLSPSLLGPWSIGGTMKIIFLVISLCFCSRQSFVSSYFIQYN